ncbi:MAG: hypothetical protein IPJ41_17810 [Phycisphaerales bacterium]|nr:hypothetical protein [Phycisphaerales bacterium]
MAEEQRAAAERVVRRVIVNGRREIALPDDLIVHGPAGRIERHPMAGSYVKGANAAAAVRPISADPYPAGGEDSSAWRRGWQSIQEG